jgi:hypothetical protein
MAQGEVVMDLLAAAMLRVDLPLRLGLSAAVLLLVPTPLDVLGLAGVADAGPFRALLASPETAG